MYLKYFYLLQIVHKQILTNVIFFICVYVSNIKSIEIPTYHLPLMIIVKLLGNCLYLFMTACDIVIHNSLYKISVLV